MNIEQIALRDMAASAYEEAMDFGVSCDSFERLANTVAAAVLAKLATQDVEPVAKVIELVAPAFHRVREAEVGIGEPLYTEAQYLAAQQRTAEACAKAVFEQAKYFGYNAHAGAVRDAALNKWREYL